MPEWLLGLVSGAILVWIGKFAELHYRRLQVQHEKILETYRELAVALAKDIQRIKGLKFTLGSDSTNQEAISDLEKRRTELLQDFARIAFQVLLLETDERMTNKVVQLISSRTDIALPAQYYQGERYSEFSTNVLKYEASCNQLIREIASKYRSWPDQMPQYER